MRVHCSRSMHAPRGRGGLLLLALVLFSCAARCCSGAEVARHGASAAAAMQAVAAEAARRASQGWTACDAGEPFGVHGKLATVAAQAFTAGYISSISGMDETSQGYKVLNGYILPIVKTVTAMTSAVPGNAIAVVGIFRGSTNADEYNFGPTMCSNIPLKRDATFFEFGVHIPAIPAPGGGLCTAAACVTFDKCGSFSASLNPDLLNCVVPAANPIGAAVQQAITQFSAVSLGFSPQLRLELPNHAFHHVSATGVHFVTFDAKAHVFMQAGAELGKVKLAAPFEALITLDISGTVAGRLGDSDAAGSAITALTAGSGSLMTTLNALSKLQLFAQFSGGFTAHFQTLTSGMLPDISVTVGSGFMSLQTPTYPQLDADGAKYSDLEGPGVYMLLQGETVLSVVKDVVGKLVDQYGSIFDTIPGAQAALKNSVAAMPGTTCKLGLSLRIPPGSTAPEASIAIGGMGVDLYCTAVLGTSGVITPSSVQVKCKMGNTMFGTYLKFGKIMAATIGAYGDDLTSLAYDSTRFVGAFSTGARSMVTGTGKTAKRAVNRIACNTYGRFSGRKCKASGNGNGANPGDGTLYAWRLHSEPNNGFYFVPSSCRSTTRAGATGCGKTSMGSWVAADNYLWSFDEHMRFCNFGLKTWTYTDAASDDNLACVSGVTFSGGYTLASYASSVPVYFKKVDDLKFVMCLVTPTGLGACTGSNFRMFQIRDDGKGGLDLAVLNGDTQFKLRDGQTTSIAGWKDDDDATPQFNNRAFQAIFG